jgi:hypothetical protein
MSKVKRSNLGRGAHPSPSGRGDPIAPPTAQVLQIITLILDLRECKVINLATPPNIDFAQPGGELRDHAQRLVRGSFPTVDIE